MSARKNPHNLSEAIRRLESSTGNGRSQIGEDLESIKKAFENLKEDVFKATGDTFTQGKERAKELGHSVDQQVHENPWWALGIIGVVAFLVGYLLGRKD